MRGRDARKIEWGDGGRAGVGSEFLAAAQALVVVEDVLIDGIANSRASGTASGGTDKATEDGSCCGADRPDKGADYRTKTSADHGLGGATGCPCEGAERAADLAAVVFAEHGIRTAKRTKHGSTSFFRA